MSTLLLLRSSAGRTPAVGGLYEYLRPAYNLPAGMTYNADTGKVDGTVMSTSYAATLPTTEVSLSDLGSRAANAAALASAISTAAASGSGTRIRLAAGADFGGAYTLPVNNSSGWIYIEAAGIKTGSLPEGTRVTSSEASVMPKLYYTAVSQPVFLFQAGNAKYRFVGLEFTLAPSGVSWGGVSSGSNNVALGMLSYYGQGANTSDFPSDIVIDRCYVHGSTSWNCQRGIRINGANVAVIDSEVTDIFAEGFSDGQCFLATAGPGPYKIVNNKFIQAAEGECVMFGGGTALQVPTNLEIQRNWFDYPIAYHGVKRFKNFYEMKVGRRALVQGNVFTNYRTEDVSGQYFPLVLKSTDQDSGAPLSGVADVTVRLNTFVNCSAWVVLARLPFASGAPMTRVELTCNRVPTPTSDYTALIRVNTMQIESTIDGVRVRHNSVARVAQSGAYVLGAPNDGANTMVDHEYTDNFFAYTGDAGLWWRNTDGVVSTGLTGWNDVSNSGALGVYSGNAITQTSSLPSGNTSVASEAAADFVSATLALNNTSPLKGTATSGRDPGAVHALIDSAIFGVT